MTIRLLLAATLSVLASITDAQPCAPAFTPTFPNGILYPGSVPVNPSVGAFCIHDDGTTGGPTLYAGGTVPSLGINTPSSIIRLDRSSGVGVWKRVFAVDGSPRALASIDLGANLPGGPFLYAAGDGLHFFGTPGQFTGIGRWDGAAWRNLGSGISGSSVYCMTMFDFGDGQGPQLVVGGNFGVIGINSPNLARWNGTAWSVMPLPQCQPCAALPRVYDLKVFDDGTGNGPQLYCAGEFADTAGTIRGVAKWSGVGWVAVPPIVPNGQFFQFVFNLAVWNDGNGPKLYAAGQFRNGSIPGLNYLARLNNGAWEPVGGGIQFATNALGPYLRPITDRDGPALYVGGWITGAGTGASTIQTSGIARWNGTTWTAPTRLLIGGDTGRAFDLAMFDAGAGPELHIGGVFDNIQTTLATPLMSSYALARVAQTGPGAGEAQTEGRGLGNNDTPSFRYSLNVVDYGGPKLAVTGTFRNAGGRASNGCSLYDGHDWETFIVPGVTSIRNTNTTVFPFNGAPRLVTSRSSGSPTGVAWWDGTAWQPISGSAWSDSRCLAVFDDGSGSAIYSSNGSIITRYQSGGSFTPLPGIPLFTPKRLLVGDLGQGPQLFGTGQVSGVFGVFRWNGAAWVNLAPGGNPMVQSPDNMIIHNDGSGPALFVTEVNIAGPTIYNRIAKLQSGAWLPLGGPSPGQVGILGGSTSIPLSLASFDDGNGPALYVGGIFNQAGGQQSRGLARWRNNSWDPMVSVLPAPLNTGEVALCVYDSGDRKSLYIAGNFANAGLGGVAADNLVEYRACPRCVADYDDGSGTGTPDGGVTLDDLLYYLDLFGAGDVRADVDDGSGTNHHDGGVGIEDLLYYLSRYDAGC
jgi:hypothetical protein